MSDFWNDTATRLRAELVATGVEPTATGDTVRAAAGEWFTDLGEKTQTAIIATMQNPPLNT